MKFKFNMDRSIVDLLQNGISRRSRVGDNRIHGVIDHVGENDRFVIDPTVLREEIVETAEAVRILNITWIER